MTSLFNGYYNGERKWREGVKEINETFQVAPSGYIPVMFHGTEEDSKTYSNYFDEAIKKCEVVLFKHPNSNWKDNCRFLMGRSNYYKRNFILARQNLEWIVKNEPDSKLMPEVYLWLVKTHYAMGNEATAKKMMEEKLKGVELSKQDIGELALFKAQMALEAEDYVTVIEILEKNMKNIKGKLNKARVHFLLGQIYADQGRLGRSYDHFKKVTKINADYQLIFNAKIRIAKLFINHADGESDNIQITKMLNKMLRDEKNLDFLDQIYFELAMLDLKKEDRPGAIQNLKYSIQTNTSNERQKALSYYHIGQIYFYDLKDFTMAQAYYDSASQSITEDAPEYDEISSISATLREYIDYVNTIHYQDSMIALAKLSPEQLEKQIDKVIADEKRREQERMRREMEELDQMRDPNLFNQMGNDQGGNRGNRGGSGFYFDDPQRISNGKLEFERIWGRRKNEDNWRRKYKNIQLANATEEETEPIDEELVEKFGDKAKYYKDVPENEDEVEAARQKVVQAMYGLGQVYQNKLNIADSAIATFKKLVRRFPDDPYALKSQYALFNIYSTVDPYIAEQYKAKICGNYPRSIYCKLCNKEDITEDLAKEFEEFNSAYTALYSTFREKDYATCLDFSSFIMTKWSTAPEMPKVLYIRGLSFGYLGKQDSMVTTYRYLIKNFPGTEQAKIARGTLARLEKGESGNNTGSTNPRSEDGNNPRLEEESPAGEDNPAYAGFTPDKRANEKVYVVMLVKKDNIQSQEVQMAVNEFNKKFYASDNLTVSIFFYKKTHHLAYVSQFEDFNAAKGYTTLALKQEGIQNILKDPGDRVVFITPQNFRTAYGKKRFEDYLLYFDNILLKSLNGK